MRFLTGRCLALLFVFAGAMTPAVGQPGAPGAGATPGESAPELPPPVFSVAGGAYDQAVELSLTHPDPKARIFYSLDGSEPRPKRIGGDHFEFQNRYAVTSAQIDSEREPFLLKTYRYAQPLSLQTPDPHAPDRLAQIATSLHEDRAPYLPLLEPLQWHERWRNSLFGALNAGIALLNKGWRHISDSVLPEIALIQPRQVVGFPKGVVVRAVAVRGKQRSATVTHTYFIGQRGFTRLPVVSLAGPADGFFSYEDGILVPGKTYDDWRRDNPGKVPAPSTPANWNREHEDVESNLEFFRSLGQGGELQPVLNQVTGVRVHGGLTRVTPNKSMRLYARKKYGQALFEHDFFGGGLQQHRRLILRNSGSDSIGTLFRDAVIQEISRDLRFEKQRYAPTVVFLNGEYRGIYNLREYQDEHYLAQKYGIDPAEIDLMDGNVAKHGDDKHWRALVSRLEGDIASRAVYEDVSRLMDVDSFIDYQIANIFFGNTDWPHNNIRHWRRRVAYTPDQPSGMDGRWRWMMFDVDFGMQNHRRDTLQGAANVKGMRSWNDTEWSTVVFRRLLLNATFRQRFEQRFNELLSGVFETGNVISHIDRARDRILPEVPRHVARWKTPASLDAWEKQINQLREFARKRPALQREQLKLFLDKLQSRKP